VSSEEHPETSLMYASALALAHIRRVTALLRRGHPHRPRTEMHHRAYLTVTTDGIFLTLIS